LSPILLRPSREQDEHDRLARHLEGKYTKRKFEVAVNVRDEQIMPVKFGALTLYPDLVLGEAKKLAGVVEIETGESVNNLEVLAQWVHFGKAKVPFHLYVPAHMYEATRRLADAYKARITEIWTYRGAVDGFDLVRLYADPNAKFPKPSTVLKPTPPKPVVVAPPPPPPPPPPPAPVKGVGRTGKTTKGKPPVAAAGKPGVPGKMSSPVPAKTPEGVPSAAVSTAKGSGTSAGKQAGKPPAAPVKLPIKPPIKPQAAPPKPSSKPAAKQAPARPAPPKPAAPVKARPSAGKPASKPAAKPQAKPAKPAGKAAKRPAPPARTMKKR
jgi:hypothetical protein